MSPYGPTTISLAEKILLKIGDNDDNHDVDVDKMMKWDQGHLQANNLYWVQQSKNQKCLEANEDIIKGKLKAKLIS